MSFNKKYFDSWIEMLRTGELKPNKAIIGSSKGDITMLESIILSNEPVNVKFDVIKQLLDFGCDVDGVNYASLNDKNYRSPLEIALQLKDDVINTSILNMMLRKHNSTQESDFSLMITAINSYDPDSRFKLVVSNKQVDVNALNSNNQHILHILVESEHHAAFIGDLFSYAPDVHLNPLDNNGNSPFTVALNIKNYVAVRELQKRKYTMIIGNFTGAETDIIDNNLVDRYFGDFWKKYPKMLNYAYKNGKFNQLPEKLKNVFF